MNPKADKLGPKMRALVQALKKNPTMGPTEYAQSAGITTMASVVLYANAKRRGFIVKAPAEYRVSEHSHTLLDG